MLINLSNHPSKDWNDKQLDAAAKQFGIVTDIPFPKIETNASEEEVKNLANKYFQICIQQLNLHPDNNNAIHIMGELPFTFSLVQKLIYAGITCVASTTERKTKEIGNKKISEFEFVKFREYVI